MGDGLGNFLGGGAAQAWSEDPQSLPSQGLARADNYNPNITDRDYQALLNTYLGNQGRILESEQKYSPQYVDLQAANTERALGANLAGLNRLMPQFNALQTGTRAANVADVNALGPEAVAALRATNPEAARLMDLMNQQATVGLEAGQDFTTDQERELQRQAVQGARARGAASGLSASNASLSDELLAQFNLGQRLQNERRAFAGQALGYNQSLYQQPALQLATSGGAGTPMTWQQYASQLAQGAGPTLLPSNASANLLGNVYGENQANNRATAGNETSMWNTAVTGLMNMI